MPRKSVPCGRRRTSSGCNTKKTVKFRILFGLLPQLPFSPSSLSLSSLDAEEEKRRRRATSPLSFFLFFLSLREKNQRPCSETRTIPTSSPGRRRGGCTRFVSSCFCVKDKQEEKTNGDRHRSSLLLSHSPSLSALSRKKSNRSNTPWRP